MKSTQWVRGCVLAASLGFAVGAARVSGVERPNFLWITCEDISPYLGCYGFEQAATPNLDRLASEGIRYTRAYANAPVCAVARSTLLTGMYASTIGTHQMRSRVRLPDVIPAYPKLLRQAGYYCTNNSKKDYNSQFERDTSLWDESSGKAHYRNRKDGQPFFAVFNIGVTHEAQLDAKRIKGYVERGEIPPRPRVDPAAIDLPPYHPDLSVIREDWARLHDLIARMDGLAGDLLRELEEQGLAESTIVFFYSDHGGQLARSKRYIYNVGTQVPFIARIPKQWSHLAPGGPGRVEDRMVSFVDFPKTVLSLAGMTPPELMQGRVFLGPDAGSAPEFVHFYRDRMAERYDFSRAVTDGRFYLIRNFMPHRPLGRDTRYGFTVQANWTAWERHYDAGLCDPVQSQFFQPKTTLQLFDTGTDPWHVDDLAGRAEHRDRIRRMDADLDAWMIATRDTGLIPEPLGVELVGEGQPFGSIYEYAQSAEYPVDRILAVARETSAGDPKRLSDYLSLMTDAHPVVRHWGAYGVFLVRSDALNARAALSKMMKEDAFAANRIMAAQALGLSGDPEAAFAAIGREARATEHGYVFLQALNAFAYSRTDDRLTREDWAEFAKRKPDKAKDSDPFGFDYAQRIVNDALALWPERRIVE